MNNKSFIGLNIAFNKENSPVFSAVEVKLIKKGFEIEEIYDHNDDFSFFINHFSAKLPVIISVSGNGILQNSSSDSIEDISERIQSILPNSKQDDFYIQSIELPQNRISTSIVRKDLINLYLNVLKEKNILVLDVFLGIEILTVLKNIPPFTKVNSLRGIGQSIFFDESGFYNLGSSDFRQSQSYEIDSKILNTFSLYALSAVLSHFYNSLSFDSTVIKYVELSRLRRKEKRATQKLLSYSFVILLFLLAINFFFSAHLENEILKIEEEMIAMPVTADNSLLEKKIALKADFLDKHRMQTIPLSYCCDQISAIVPEGLFLTSMHIFPPQDQKRNKSDEAFYYDRILISGKSTRVKEIHDLLQNLEIFSWVKKATLNELKAGKENNVLKFNIIIGL